MIKKIWNWIFGSNEEIYWPGQRVRLVSHYPCDIADEANRRYVYGTVQPKTDDDHKDSESSVLVLFDNYDGVRFMESYMLSPYIYIETDKVRNDALRTLR